MIKYMAFTFMGLFLSHAFLACKAYTASVPVKKDLTSIYTENFENFNMYAAGMTGDGFALFSEVDEGCGTNNSRCLRHHYKPSDIGSRPQVRYYPLPKALEYTLQYDIRFDADFEFVQGGKLHGLTPEFKTTGCNPQVPQGWSARVMWRQNGIAELYVYDQSRKKNGIACGWSYPTSKPVFKKGVYQAVSLYVKLNTIGQADGIAELWIDGKKEAEATQVEYRGTAKNTEISRLAYSTFFGGHDPSWAPSKSVYASLDNVEVLSGRQVRSSPL